MSTIAINSKEAHNNEPRLLYDRKTAAGQLSISIRALDYLIVDGTIKVRRIGSRVLIPHAELIKFAGRDHYGPIAEKAA